MKYESVTEEQKLQLLIEQDLGDIKWKSLDQKAWCLHCDEQFTGRDVRAYREGRDLLLECGNRGCNGSPLDWAGKPWWR